MNSNKIVEVLRQKQEYNPLPSWGEAEYTGWMDENVSWKTSCSLGDWSFGGNKGVLVEGPDALKLFSDLSVNNLKNFKPNQVKHLVMCNQNGKCIINGLLFNRGDGSYYWQHHADWPMYNMEKGNYNCKMTKTPFYGIQIAGPTSIHVIEKLCGESIRDIQFMNFRNITIAGKEVMCIRQNMASEIGYELEGPIEYHDEIIKLLMEAGKEFGIRRIGWRSVFMNHLESGISQTDYIPAIYDDFMSDYYNWLVEKKGIEHALRYRISGSFESNDIRDWYRSPFEQGWGPFVKFDHDFIGREALEKEALKPQRTWVSLEWNEEDIIDVYASLMRPGPHFDYMDLPKHFTETVDPDVVLKDGKMVGTATSRGFSYYFRKMISHCVIDVEYSTPGTEVEVLWGQPGHPQKYIRAIVCKSPYKEDHRKDDVTKLPNYL